MQQIKIKEETEGKVIKKIHSDAFYDDVVVIEFTDQSFFVITGESHEQVDYSFDYNLCRLDKLSLGYITEDEYLALEKQAKEAFTEAKRLQACNDKAALKLLLKENKK